MIGVRVPKDIRKYETRVIGPLSLRQTICGGIAIGLCVVFYQFVSKPLGLSQDAMFFGCFLVAIVPLLIGWVKPYGINFEDFAKVAITTSVVFPAIRTYKTRNTYDPDRKPIPKDRPTNQDLDKKTIANTPEFQAFK